MLSSSFWRMYLERRRIVKNIGRCIPSFLIGLKVVCTCLFVCAISEARVVNILRFSQERDNRLNTADQGIGSGDIGVVYGWQLLSF